MYNVKRTGTMRRTKPKKAAASKKTTDLASKYVTYFAPNPSPLWRRDEDTFSLEQPSVLKWTPTETVYSTGVDPALLNA